MSQKKQVTRTPEWLVMLGRWPLGSDAMFFFPLDEEATTASSVARSRGGLCWLLWCCSSPVLKVRDWGWKSQQPLQREKQKVQLWH